MNAGTARKEPTKIEKARAERIAIIERELASTKGELALRSRLRNLGRLRREDRSLSSADDALLQRILDLNYDLARVKGEA